MSKTLQKEVLNIAAITFLMGAVQFIIASLLGYFEISAALGTLLGCLTAIMNFALMGIILEKSLSGKTMASGLAGFGYILRLAIIAVIVIWAMKVDYLNYVCAVIPLIFPQAAIFIINRKRKDRDENERT